MCSTVPTAAKAVLCAVLLSSPHVLFAADFSHAMTFGGYTISVRDLTPDDALTAGYTSELASHVIETRYYGRDELDQRNVVEWGPPVDEISLRSDGIHGDASVVSSGGFASSVLTNNALATMLQGGHELRSAQFDRLVFELQPYTELTITIPISYTWSSSGASIPVGPGYISSASLRASTSLSQQTTESEDGWSAFHREAGGGTVTDSLSLTLANNSAEVYHNFAYLTFSMGIDRETIAVPVPEPATWCMLGAGLGMLALRQRRERGIWG